MSGLEDSNSELISKISKVWCSSKMKEVLKKLESISFSSWVMDTKKAIFERVLVTLPLLKKVSIISVGSLHWKNVISYNTRLHESQTHHVLEDKNTILVIFSLHRGNGSGWSDTLNIGNARGHGELLFFSE